MGKRWYKLDNAAKVFPAVSNPSRTNIFRLSFMLYEEVDPLILQKAIELSIKRFPMFNVRLKKGLFWYYFETNDAIPHLQIESRYICRMFEGTRDNNNFLFRLSYFGKRVSLETFHSLTDGTGALEFLKSIIYQYFELQEIEVESTNILTQEVEIINEELQDSFNMNYNAKLKSHRTEARALKFKTPRYSENWMGVITGTAYVDDLKKVTKKYDCTITELLGSLIMYAASRSQSLFENKDKPFTLFVPVNLRRFFPSRTLRNFSLYVRSAINLSENLSFEEILNVVKKDMQEELQKEKLQTRFTSTVRTERNFVMRIAPIVLKEIALKIGYNLLGDAVNSFSFSNIGVVNLSDEMKKHIDRIVFTVGASPKTPINLGAISFNNKITMTFSSFLLDRSIQREFFRFLANEGVKIVIESNELEV